MCPSTEPENATPGIALTAADCAGLQRLRSPQSAGGVYQTRSPLSSRSANMPPPALGSGSDPWLLGIVVRTISDNATYTFDWSAAEPHCTPPTVCFVAQATRRVPCIRGSHLARPQNL